MVEREGGEREGERGEREREREGWVKEEVKSVKEVVGDGGGWRHCLKIMCGFRILICTVYKEIMDLIMDSFRSCN